MKCEPEVNRGDCRRFDRRDYVHFRRSGPSGQQLVDCGGAHLYLRSRSLHSPWSAGSIGNSHPANAIFGERVVVYLIAEVAPRTQAEDAANWPGT